MGALVDGNRHDLAGIVRVRHLRFEAYAAHLGHAAL